MTPLAQKCRGIIGAARRDLGTDIGWSVVDLCLDQLSDGPEEVTVDGVRAALVELGELSPGEVARPGACRECGQSLFHTLACRAQLHPHQRVLYCPSCTVYVEVGGICTGDCAPSACVHDPGCPHCK